MSWKKIRSVKLPYDRQMMIKGACLFYHEQPAETREKIDRLCREIGGEYEKELKDFLTTRKTAVQICMENYVSETTLYELRKKFYESW